jgi:UDP:flavonoid glycosyltransferase YjiC (YdhE family)
LRVALLTIGSRGDAYPLVALGAGLRAAGHEVRLGAPADVAALAAAHGLEFRPVMESFEEFLASPAGQQAFAALRAPWRGLVNSGVVPQAMRPRLLQECARASAGAQAIVCGLGVSWFGAALARAGRRPLAFAHLMPDLPTRRFAHPFFPAWRLGAAYRRASFALASRGAPRRAGDDESLRLVAISPSVLERPDDWPAQAQMTGYWFAPPRGAAAASELERFVASGAAPLFVGFGSTLDARPAALEGFVRHTLRETGTRAVFVRGMGAAFGGSREPDLFSLDAADFDWLLPRVAAAIHHGGAGTTAACIRAGLPQVIVPYGTDQPFWGARMVELGVAAACIPRRRLTAERLASAARRALGDGELRRRAAELGARVRAEDGVRRAIELLESHWRRATPQASAAPARG